VVFGATVELEEESSGEAVTYQIVGEDEADPAKGLIPYVAPLAKALLGKSVGDGVEVIHHSAKIVEIG
jgi:transcription elongation GreA/GreB family factor